MAIAAAILDDPETRSVLAGYVGPDNPDSTFQSKDLSGDDTFFKAPDNRITTYPKEGEFTPDIDKVTTGGESKYVLNGGTIEIDDRVTKGDQLTGVVLEESKHAGDARNYTAGYVNASERDKNKPYEDKVLEDRAKKFKKNHKNDIKRAADRIKADPEKMHRLLNGGVIPD